MSIPRVVAFALYLICPLSSSLLTGCAPEVPLEAEAAAIAETCWTSFDCPLGKICEDDGICVEATCEQ